MDASDILIYLRTNERLVWNSENDSDSCKFIADNYQLPSELIENIRKGRERVGIQLWELIYIATTCRVIFQWLEFKEKNSPFEKVLRDGELFDDCMDPKKWYLKSLAGNDFPVELYESIEMSYEGIKAKILLDYRKYRQWKRRHAFTALFYKKHEIEFFNIMLNVDICLNLGLLTDSGEKVKTKLFNGEFKSGIFDYISEGFTQWNIKDRNDMSHAVENGSQKEFFNGAATKCMETYIQIWEAETGIDLRNSKRKCAEGLSGQEQGKNIIDGMDYANIFLKY
ncbi:MAG: hypothetical protein K6G00_09515 [Treponema sp.]|nr:hypothetical protein [Treponema sp.]